MDVSAGIDIRNGQAFWTITAIDPKTGEVPTNPLIGFLPPNDANHSGEGFVSYSVKARASVQSGDVIDAQARIIFDLNLPIDTPAIFNTLDTITPTSTVEALPGTSTGTEFLVSWSGLDDEHGSAIHDYSIFVGTDGGPFEIWLNETSLTTSRFTGSAGHSYSFYSVARDNGGRREAVPNFPDAVTTTFFAGIAGRLFEDVNVNGIRDTGEQILPGRTVFLDLNGDGQLTAGELSSTTDANGAYVFANLTPGTYRVKEQVPSGWFQTSPSGFLPVSISGGEVQTGKDIGSLRMILDVNADGEATPQDAIVILRYLSLVTGPALTAGVVTGGSRTDPAAIKSYLDGVRTTMLDVNADGQATPQDAIVILRHLSLVSGPALTAGVVTGGQRTNPQDIKNFLDSFMPGAVQSAATSTESTTNSSALSTEPVGSGAVTDPTVSTQASPPSSPEVTENSTPTPPLTVSLSPDMDSSAIAATQLNYQPVETSPWVSQFVSSGAIEEEDELTVVL